MFLLILLLPSWSPRSSWTEIRRRGIKINNNDGSQGWWDRDQSLTSIPPWFTERRQGSVVFHWALHLQQCVKSMKYNPTIKKRKHINTTPEKTVFMCNFKFYFKIVTELTLAKTIFLGLTYCLEGGDFWQPPPPHSLRGISLHFVHFTLGFIINTQNVLIFGKSKKSCLHRLRFFKSSC